jgi:hypothetical protein
MPNHALNGSCIDVLCRLLVLEQSPRSSGAFACSSHPEGGDLQFVEGLTKKAGILPCEAIIKGIYVSHSLNTHALSPMFGLLH